MNNSTDNDTDTDVMPDFMKPAGFTPGNTVFSSGMGTINGDEVTLLPERSPGQTTTSVPNYMVLSGGTSPRIDASPDQSQSANAAVGGALNQGVVNFMVPRQQANGGVSGYGQGQGQWMTTRMPDYMVQSGGSSPKGDASPYQPQTVNSTQDGNTARGGEWSRTLDLGNGLSIQSSGIMHLTQCRICVYLGHDSIISSIFPRVS